MMHRPSKLISTGLGLLALFLLVSPALAQQSKGLEMSAENRRIVEHWTPTRRAHAVPRDLYLDAAGQAYIRGANGALQAYGGQGKTQLRATSVPMAKPPSTGGGGNDSTPPLISALNPGAGSTIGASHEFSAQITDASGIRSVSFVVSYPDGVTTQSFSPGFAGNDTWSISLEGFSDGAWSWHVVAKDGAKKGGNSASSAELSFSVDTGGTGSGTGGDHITSNAAWTAGGAVRDAAGRIYFEMPTNSRRKRWSGYVCSGTVASDGSSGRSVIITAAHCVYDDANKAFARNVLFIPNQAGTSGSGTDTNCANDPMGCWTPAFGVVDADWTTRSFPNNVAWDYAYYVVNDSGAHAGSASASDALDVSAGSMGIDFSTPYTDDGDASASSLDFTHALGYSYSDDPNFMYCAEDMSTETAVNWWLASCGLSGGASGGPWVQPLDTSSGNGPIISVNSWGYTTAPGMAGPRLDVSSAACLFAEAKAVSFASIPEADGDAGLAVNYCP